jgi:hypothetical protein
MPTVDFMITGAGPMYGCGLGSTLAMVASASCVRRSVQTIKRKAPTRPSNNPSAILRSELGQRGRRSDVFTMLFKAIFSTVACLTLAWQQPPGVW